jgi:protein-tyrosine-phosphatase
MLRAVGGDHCVRVLPGRGLRITAVPRVLFVCIENACRSQMAAGFARRHGANRVEVHSAGSQPADAINPRAVAFMAERGCDISAQVPVSLGEFADQAFDAVITMGCGDACPWVPAQNHEDWALPDPKHLADDEFRAIRDEIERRVQRLLAKLNAAAQAPSR